MLCVRLGRAKKVIGLEKSDCIEYARRIVEDNAYSHVITLIQSSVIINLFFLYIENSQFSKFNIHFLYLG